MKVLLILAKNSGRTETKLITRSALFHMKTRVGLQYFVNDCRIKIIITDTTRGKKAERRLHNKKKKKKTHDSTTANIYIAVVIYIMISKKRWTLIFQNIDLFASMKVL